MREFERLADVGKVDVLQPDLSRCGGLTVGRQIAEMAMRRQIDCVPAFATPSQSVIARGRVSFRGSFDRVTSSVRISLSGVVRYGA